MLNERLKKILYLGLSVSMVASVGASTTQPIANARHVRSHRVMHRHLTYRQRKIIRRNKRFLSSVSHRYSKLQRKLKYHHYSQKRVRKYERQIAKLSRQITAETKAIKSYFQSKSHSRIKFSINYKPTKHRKHQFRSTNPSKLTFTAKRVGSIDYDNNSNVSPNNDSTQSNQQIKSNIKETISDINNLRNQNGKTNVTENSDLDKLAQMRAVQNYNNGYKGHYDSNGNAYEADDANKLGLNLNMGDGVPLEADNASENLAWGYDNARQANNDLMYHDSPSWGHRKSILNPQWNYVGIGWHNGSLAEEFATSVSKN